MNSAAPSTIVGLALATALIKAFGPVIFGGCELPQLLARTIPLLAPAALRAPLVVVVLSAAVATALLRALT
jgi:hypothetical protein